MEAQVQPVAHRFWTTDPAEPVAPQVGSVYPANLPPVTLTEALRQTAGSAETSNRVSYRFREGDHMREVTWLQHYGNVQKFAKACVACDVQPHTGVAIQGANAYPWVVAYMGAIFAGALSTGIYPSSGADDSKFVASMCRAQIIVVDDEAHLEKYAQETHGVLDTAVKCYVVWGNTTKKHVNETPVYSWEDFCKLGENVSDDRLDERSRIQRPGHCAVVIPTSGTTGRPKGVMVGNDAATWTARVIKEGYQIGKEDRVLSYLPLGHIAGQMLDILGPMMAGAAVTFAPADALKNGAVLKAAIQECRPTVFLGVPRVWAKIHDAMADAGANLSFVKRRIAAWAKRKGLEAMHAIEAGEPLPRYYGLANRLVFSRVKEQLGLDECRLFVTGSAPTSQELKDYFGSLGIPLLDVYGSSETSGPTTVSLPNAFRSGTVGKALAGTELVIGEGDEITARGRNNFMGYIGNEAATAKTITDQGFVLSGDKGQIDDKGFLSITGRIKELIITEGGKKVPPVPIEDNIKLLMERLVSNVMLIGDNRKFISCLLTLKVTEQNGQPTGNLAPSVLALFEEIGATAKNLEEAAKDPVVLAYLQEGLNRYNMHPLFEGTRVEKFTILPAEFSEENGLLTPTKKLKRAEVVKMYAEMIEKMYAV